MLQKKVCLLGSFSVGKTSLIAQFVHGIFGEKYLTTIGVKIDKRRVTTEKGETTLVIWDLNGQDDLQKVRLANLRGSSGFLFVVDGTRPATLNVVLELDALVQREMGALPRLLLLNKCDLQDEWLLEASRVEELRAAGWHVKRTSAKTGEQVAEAFGALAEMMVR
ncbi:Rab family GTPase [Acanthopleuribacter pedis]|uniref:GTP-binding protein n=1 Tax=Acanthopleuribacter pedis TaxID=442870 RepID=A0A8J7Q2I2_9BACT|nr:Rab family GTPase [Acanthopleuribacter pedis]MBO1319342.1 GTP-binding protein [Acanthopleuribacter pedis]